MVIRLDFKVTFVLYTCSFAFADKTFLDKDIEYTDTTLYKLVLQIIFLLHGMYCLDSVLIASNI